MQFSLIVATMGRTAELVRLLESLDRQTYRGFDLIIVDQNEDDRASKVIEPFGQRMSIVRLTSPPGASRARNAGIPRATGDIVVFPDDDCWYPSDLLARLSALFDAHPQWDGILTHGLDENGTAVMPWGDAPGRLTRPMAWRRASTWAFFLRRELVQRVGLFDQTMASGPGTWGTGEDADFILRALRAGACLRYQPALHVRHPRHFQSFEGAPLLKRYRYAMGDGHLLRLHPMPLWWMGAFFGVPLLRAARAAVLIRRPEARFHLATFRGRVAGFRAGAERKIPPELPRMKHR